MLTVFIGGNHETSVFLQVCDRVGSEGFGRLVGICCVFVLRLAVTLFWV